MPHHPTEFLAMISQFPIGHREILNDDIQDGDSSEILRIGSLHSVCLLEFPWRGV